MRDEHRQRYAPNAYRVLLTRARQDMVIFVPPGNKDDTNWSHRVIMMRRFGF